MNNEGQESKFKVPPNGGSSSSISEPIGTEAQHVHLGQKHTSFRSGFGADEGLLALPGISCTEGHPECMELLSFPCPQKEVKGDRSVARPHLDHQGIRVLMESNPCWATQALLPWSQHCQIWSRRGAH